MNEEIIEMMNIYNTFSIDWMGDEIKNHSDLTRHHIVKKEKNGSNSIDTYALLTTNSHHLIHYLEVNYNKEYNMINSLLMELNKSRNEPTTEYFLEMNSILKKVRKDIKNKKRKRK
jgi:hypothetical protein